MKRLLLAVFYASIALAWWSPPIDLGINEVNDINPQACRVQILGDFWIVVVWESYVDGNADIFSRFSDGSTWSDTFRITTDIGQDVSPHVAYDYTRDCFWCVWEHYYGTGNDGIYVSQGNEMTGWSLPYQLTSDPLDEDLPSICVISDTIWVVWQQGMLFGDSMSFMNIHAAYYDGNMWSAPYPLTSDSNVVNCNAKIGIWYGHPLVVWEKNGDIYYCEYLNGTWQIPQPITNDAYEDVHPEIAAMMDYWGVWVVWQTDRDGNFEIYTTAYDTFNLHYRKTFNDSSDISPSPLPFIAVTRQEGPPITAFSTNRNGNNDIYTLFSLGYPGDTLIQVSTSPADDVSPVMTGSVMYLWVIWQTDRNGDWDIYGSYIFIGGTEEHWPDVSRTAPHISPNPAKTLFMLHSPVPVQNIRIYDVLGKLVRAVRFAEFKDNEEISLMGINSGVYFVKVVTDENEFIRKVIVTK